MDWKLITRHGPSIPVEIHTRLLYQDGRPMAFSIARNVTDIRFTEERFRILFDRSPV